jgi:hypothetical protein
MSDELTIVRMGMPADNPANQERRIKQCIALLREVPNSRKNLVVAGEEFNGFIPVTIARWISTNQIFISDMGVKAGCWGPAEFLSEINQKSRVSPSEMRKAARVAAGLGRA